MAPATIPTAIPLQAVAGDTWRWDRVVADYPPTSGWTLNTAFRGASILDVVAAVNGATYQNTVLPAQTKELAAGAYTWIEFVSNAGGERYTIGSGVLDVAPDVAAAIEGQLQSFEEKAIAVIEASMLDDGIFEDWMEEFTIAGRHVRMISIEDRYALLAKFRTRVARQKNGGRLPSLRVRFGV